MNTLVRETLANTLIELAGKLKAGTSEVSEEQAIEIVKLVAHRPLSKEEAAIHLNMSTKKFDILVKEGYFPKGRKRIGWKELAWYEDEIDKVFKRLDE